MMMMLHTRGFTSNSLPGSLENGTSNHHSKMEVEKDAHHSLPEHLVVFHQVPTKSNHQDEDNHNDKDIDIQKDNQDIQHYNNLLSCNTWYHHLSGRYLHSLVTGVLALALVAVLASNHTIPSNNNHNSLTNPSLESTNTTSTSTTATFDDIPWAPLPDPSQRISKIAFGSCMKEDMPMPFWDTLMMKESLQPDITVLGGDNVYSLHSNACHGHDNCTMLQQAYQNLNAHPSFQGAKRHLPMVAMLDDHDYGMNDCHANNPYKDIAKQLYLDFYNISANDERRYRSNEGLYTSYEWGTGTEIVQLILLDTRYSGSEFLYDEANWAYVPYSADQESGKRFLSETQWEWFEQILQRPAQVRLIVSTQQVLTKGVWGFESWNQIPRERHRLVQLLKKYCSQVTNTSSLPILLSGDRHIGAFYNDPTLWSDLYEVTASSWTHTIPDGWDPDGIQCQTKEDCFEADETRLGDDWVNVNHFGMIQIDWEHRQVHVNLIQAETSPGYYVQQQWEHNTDAGQILKSLTLAIPS